MRRYACHHDCSHREIVLTRISNILELLAAALVVASNFVSCSSKISEADALELETTPMQTVDDVFAVRSTNGKLKMRLEAEVMEHYETKTEDLDVFPKGISVFAYSDDGLLESIVIADNAVHKVPKNSGDDSDETWEAYGNVVLHNVVKQETMETDTLYWDRTKQEVYTDCYVKIYSPDGFMQGYGMRSDDRMKNATLYKSFNNFVVVEKDTTAVMIDSVNFIGPFPKKIDKFAP